MVRTLNSFLFREGSSDEYFLPRILQRGLIELCGHSAVAIAPVIPLRVAGPLVTGVCAAAESVADMADIFFYHFDGSANVTRETRKYWQPLQTGWTQAGIRREVVPVVPVREMEAWALGDAEALQATVRTSGFGRSVFEHQRLGVPEELTDPKRTLAEILAASRHGNRARYMGAARYLPALAEQVSLSALRRLSSFQRWESDTTQALRKLRIIQ